MNPPLSPLYQTFVRLLPSYQYPQGSRSRRGGLGVDDGWGRLRRPGEIAIHPPRFLIEQCYCIASTPC